MFLTKRGNIIDLVDYMGRALCKCLHKQWREGDDYPEALRNAVRILKTKNIR